MRIQLMRILTATLLSLGIAGAPATAQQAYPNRPVKLIVPFPAGGGTDTTARVIAEELRGSLGQTFVVDNKPGATGNIGTEMVAKAAPDGYTLVVVPNSLSINDRLYPQLPFRAEKDLVPVALLGSSPVVLAGRADLPFRNVEQLIAHAKANPGKLSYTSCGVGSPQHIAGELFKSMAGIRMEHIPYKGCAPALTDVVGGSVDIVFSTVANIRPFVQSGKIRAYAVTTARRSSFVPDLPTVQESGLKDYDVDVWFGMLAPARTPQAVVDSLNAAVNRALQKPAVRQNLANLYYEPVGGTPRQFADIIRRDIERYGKAIDEAAIKPE